MPKIEYIYVHCDEDDCYYGDIKRIKVKPAYRISEYWFAAEFDNRIINVTTSEDIFLSEKGRSVSNKTKDKIINALPNVSGHVGFPAKPASTGKPANKPANKPAIKPTIKKTQKQTHPVKAKNSVYAYRYYDDGSFDKIEALFYDTVATEIVYRYCDRGILNKRLHRSSTCDFFVDAQGNQLLLPNKLPNQYDFIKSNPDMKKQVEDFLYDDVDSEKVGNNISRKSITKDMIQEYIEDLREIVDNLDRIKEDIDRVKDDIIFHIKNSHLLK